jgi:hypothetical protein
MFHVSENLREPRKLSSIVVHAFSHTTLGKRGSPCRRTADKSADDHGIASVMPAWTAGIQVCKDASGDIHVNLGSGNPCRNDDIEEYSPKLTKFGVANSRTPKNHLVTLRAAINMLVFVDG